MVEHQGLFSARNVVYSDVAFNQVASSLRGRGLQALLTGKQTEQGELNHRVLGYYMYQYNVERFMKDIALMLLESRSLFLQ